MSERAVGPVLSPLKDRARLFSPVSSNGVCRFRHRAERPGNVRLRHVDHPLQLCRQSPALLGVAQVTIAKGVLGVVTHLKQIGSDWPRSGRLERRRWCRRCCLGRRLTTTTRESERHDGKTDRAGYPHSVQSLPQR
jgi:hypothetical protein